jgi:hypothetical protein
MAAQIEPAQILSDYSCWIEIELARLIYCSHVLEIEPGKIIHCIQFKIYLVIVNS